MGYCFERVSQITLASVMAASALTAQAGIELELLGTYGQPDPAAAFDESAAEIVAFDKRSQRLFVTNGNEKVLDIISISDPASPSLVGSINVTDNPDFGAFVGGGANSVAVYKGLVAAAIEADTVTDDGAVAFFDTDGNFLSLAIVCALPDMLTFTPDGSKVLAACEGEPDEGVDPEGGVAIIDVKRDGDIRRIRIADFNDFDDDVDTLRAAGVRLFPEVGTPPLAEGEISVSQDVEPEYIGVDKKGKTAYVTLQEANALAVVNIRRGVITDILPLGTKDHSLAGNGLDPSDRDGGIAIGTWPVRGLYMPDAIDCYTPKGRGKGRGKKTFCITANEGDDRGDADEDARGDAIRFKDIEDVVSFGRTGLNASAALDAMDLGADEALGRLNISSIDGIDENGDLDQLFAYGARSFSIWDEHGNLVFDSGDMLEQITSLAFPEYFNASNDANEDDGAPAIDDRSDNKGPEPEAVTIAKIRGQHYAFIGLERIGGVAVFDVSDPKDPEFVLYENNRDFLADNEAVEMGLAGDFGPESILIIEKKDSPLRGTALMVVANEVSGTTTVYAIHEVRGRGRGKK
ncbi:MAG: choice-of-anchor I family protein [Halieaceae bacterium]|jgi:hypothetical protein|nr:choice-of-anchor I family protein [Halieaceae bacterium]